MSESLLTHGLQHTRLSCPSPSPEFAQTHVLWFSNAIQPSHPLWSSFPSPSIFPSKGSFPVSQLFTSGGWSIGAIAIVLPMNIQDWFPLGLTSLIFLLCKGLSRVSLSTTVQKHKFFSTLPSLWSNSHICPWLLEKP